MRLVSVLERFSISTMVRFASSAFAARLRGNGVPIQSLIFFTSRQFEIIASEIASLERPLVYLDGVRTLEYARRLRERFPNLHMTCDLDDLMSRRANELLERDLPIRMGYLSHFVPGFVQKLILHGPIGRTLLRYERAALARAEAEMCALCEKVVLLSEAEARYLRSAAPRELHARILVIPPTFSAKRAGIADVPVERFVFVGSDLSLQNQLTIDFLLQLWSTEKPNLALHIYGRMKRSYPSVPQVEFFQFAPIEAIYTPGSVALCPAFIRGGVKTKVLEALEYGIVPLGDSISFEGISESTTLRIDTPSLRRFIKEPANRYPELVHAALALKEELSERLSVERIGARWREALGTTVGLQQVEKDRRVAARDRRVAPRERRRVFGVRSRRLRSTDSIGQRVARRLRAM
jgi:hypothetical protein